LPPPNPYLESGRDRGNDGWVNGKRLSRGPHERRKQREVASAVFDEFGDDGDD
jgi:hypothetical protein